MFLDKNKELDLWAHRYKDFLLKRSLDPEWEEHNLTTLIAGLEPVEVLVFLCEQSFVSEGDILDELMAFLVAKRDSEDLPF